MKVKAFVNSTNLKEINLSQNTSITTAGWQALASLFLNPNSSIEIVYISNNDDIDRENASFDDDAVFAWVNALSIKPKNNKLKILRFSSQGVSSSGWSALENLVCNKTSIDSLYDSNHTLSYTEYEEGPNRLIHHSYEETVPTSIKSYQEFEDECCMEAYWREDGYPDTKPPRWALRKIVQFYFRNGETNMKEILDMELNVMACLGNNRWLRVKASSYSIRLWRPCITIPDHAVGSGTI